MTKTEIFTSFKKGLPIGRNGVTIKWSTPLHELEKVCEVYNASGNQPIHVYFGQKELLSGVTLGLYTPFDTFHNNKNKETFFHAGQNVNENSLKMLVTALTNVLGEADEQSDTDGVFRKWHDQGIEICIFPRSHHGSDWNAITIVNKNIL